MYYCLLTEKHGISPLNSSITFSRNRFQQQLSTLFVYTIQYKYVYIHVCAVHEDVCGMLGTALYRCMIDSVLLEAVRVK